ncbi:MAG TPA: hypothetical protein ENI17_15810 [Pseudomonas xinjiangensis]|uniref:Uncharacterized protein n=2 Tax=root TaxID=1 RepID=A0A7V1BNP6_9GAMM|nr:hypothetical protein [Halopseudomonas xinjiangensis]HEC49067.1 hypothetical protein [Halopseudomonas xinjiangensis]
MSTTDQTHRRATQLTLPLKYVGIIFMVAIVVNAVVIFFFRGSPFVYAVIPFNLAYIFSVAWLAKAAYSWFMAVITVLLTVFPVGVLIIMLLAYSRATKELKELGYKPSFSGNLKEI